MKKFEAKSEYFTEEGIYKVFYNKWKIKLEFVRFYFATFDVSGIFVRVAMSNQNDHSIIEKMKRE